jgi:hypothetical protein
MSLCCSREAAHEAGNHTTAVISIKKQHVTAPVLRSGTDVESSTLEVLADDSVQSSVATSRPIVHARELSSEAQSAVSPAPGCNESSCHSAFPELLDRSDDCNRHLVAIRARQMATEGVPQEPHREQAHTQPLFAVM